MTIETRHIGYRLTIWLVTELWLGFLGLDDLADYSEFLAEDKVIAQPTLSLALVIMVKANSEKTSPCDYFTPCCGLAI